MAEPSAESAVRNYLTALRDPSSLRDEERVSDLQKRLDSSTDPIERLRLRKELDDAQTPALDRYEADFVTHARTWAAEFGISAKVFADEGVPPQVLRQAGLSTGGRGRGRSASGPRARRGSRVTTAEVRQAIPRGQFTVKQLQQLSGASPQVVRKVVKEETDAGNLKAEQSRGERSGPGRQPIVYRRA